MPNLWEKSLIVQPLELQKVGLLASRIQYISKRKNCIPRKKFQTTFSVTFKLLTLPVRGSRVCGYEGAKSAPLRNQWRSRVRSLPYLRIELTWKKLDPNIKKTYQYFEIWKSCLIEIFASGCVTKSTITRSIFKIEGSSFGFSLIFMGFTNHVLQLRLSE